MEWKGGEFQSKAYQRLYECFFASEFKWGNKEQGHCSIGQLPVMMSLSGWAVHMCGDILVIALLTSLKKKKPQVDTEDILHSREKDLDSYKLCFI